MQTMKIFKPFLLLFVVAISTISLSAQEIVWPGDVNNNGVVNEVDLLFLGLGFGQSGPARKTISGEWEQQAISTPWATSAVAGLDLSLADCNGDGIIDANDVEVIRANFGLTHNDVVFVPDEIPLATAGIDPAFSVPEDTNLDIFPNSSSITIPIHLGTDTLAVESLLGISFTITVNGETFDTTATQFELNGWLPNESATLIRSEDLAVQSRPQDYFVAYAKTNQLPSNGSGLIGELTLTPSFVVIGNVPDFRVSIDSVILIDEQRNKTPILGTEVLLTPARFLDSTSATSTICQGESINFNSALLTESGIYRDTLENAFGGDSISILNLNVLPTATATLNATICQGEQYVFAGDTLTQAGLYTSVTSSLNGCDSTTTLPVSYTHLTLPTIYSV